MYSPGKVCVVHTSTLYYSRDTPQYIDTFPWADLRMRGHSYTNYTSNCILGVFCPIRLTKFCLIYGNNIYSSYKPYIYTYIHLSYVMVVTCIYRTMTKNQKYCVHCCMRVSIVKNSSTSHTVYIYY